MITFIHINVELIYWKSTPKCQQKQACLRSVSTALSTWQETWHWRRKLAVSLVTTCLFSVHGRVLYVDAGDLKVVGEFAVHCISARRCITVHYNALFTFPTTVNFCLYGHDLDYRGHVMWFALKFYHAVYRRVCNSQWKKTNLVHVKANAGNLFEGVLPWNTSPWVRCIILDNLQVQPRCEIWSAVYETETADSGDKPQTTGASPKVAC